jgi:hypothetical protein
VIVGAIIVVASTDSLLIEVLGTIAPSAPSTWSAASCHRPDVEHFKERPGEKRDDG